MSDRHDDPSSGASSTGTTPTDATSPLRSVRPSADSDDLPAEYRRRLGRLLLTRGWAREDARGPLDEVWTHPLIPLYRFTLLEALERAWEMLTAGDRELSADEASGALRVAFERKIASIAGGPEKCSGELIGMAGAFCNRDATTRRVVNGAGRFFCDECARSVDVPTPAWFKEAFTGGREGHRRVVQGIISGEAPFVIVRYDDAGRVASADALLLFAARGGIDTPERLGLTARGRRLLNEIGLDYGAVEADLNRAASIVTIANREDLKRAADDE